MTLNRKTWKSLKVKKVIILYNILRKNNFYA